MTTVSPFARWAAHLLDGGYSPIPLHAVTGLPLLRRWDGLRSEALSVETISHLASRHPGLGLAVAGGFRGLVPIDIDTDDAGVIDAVCDVLPPPKAVKASRRGYTGFYFDPTGKVGGRKFQTPKPYAVMLVEILATGVTTIPPTRHRKTGQPYRWLTKATLLNTRVSELSIVTSANVEALERALTPWIPPKPVYVAPPASDAVEASDKRQRAYAQAVLDGEARMLAAMGKDSGRNWSLFLAACKLGKYVHHKVLGLNEIERVLLGACQVNGLLEEDGMDSCRATLASGIRKSQHDPLPVLGSRPQRTSERAAA